MRYRFAQAVLAGEREAHVVVRDVRIGPQLRRSAVGALGLGVAPGEGARARLLQKPVELYGTKPGIFDSSTSSICSLSRNISA